MSHVINKSVTKFTLFILSFKPFSIVEKFSKLLKIFNLICCMSNNIVTNVEHNVDVIGDFDSIVFWKFLAPKIKRFYRNNT